MRPRKRPLPDFFLRSYVEHQAAHVAQEFAARVAEVIVLAIEVGAVGIDHPREAHRLVLDLVELLEAAQQTGLHALVFFFQIILAVDGFAHVHAAEEIVVFARHRAELRIGGQVLQIGLDHRGAGRKRLDQAVLALR